MFEMGVPGLGNWVIQEAHKFIFENKPKMNILLNKEFEAEYSSIVCY